MEVGWSQNALQFAVLLAILGARRGSVLLAASSRDGGLPVCYFARWQCWDHTSSGAAGELQGFVALFT